MTSWQPTQPSAHQLLGWISGPVSSQSTTHPGLSSLFLATVLLLPLPTVNHSCLGEFPLYLTVSLPSTPSPSHQGLPVTPVYSGCWWLTRRPCLANLGR